MVVHKLSWVTFHYIRQPRSICYNLLSDSALIIPSFVIHSNKLEPLWLKCPYLLGAIRGVVVWGPHWAYLGGLHIHDIIQIWSCLLRFSDHVLVIERAVHILLWAMGSHTFKSLSVLAQPPLKYILCLLMCSCRDIHTSSRLLESLQRMLVQFLERGRLSHGRSQQSWLWLYYVQLIVMVWGHIWQNISLGIHIWEACLL